MTVALARPRICGSFSGVVSDSDWLNLLTTLVNAGARIDWYKSANGTAPTAAAITSAPVTVYPSLYGGMW